MATDVGTGATLGLVGASYDIEITGISQGDETVPVIDVTHLGTEGSRIKMCGDLIDHGELTIEAHLDHLQMDAMKLALGETNAITIELAKQGTETTGTKVTGSGAITSHNYSIPLEDKMTCGYTITWLGAVTYTDGFTA